MENSRIQVSITNVLNTLNGKYDYDMRKLCLTIDGDALCGIQKIEIRILGKDRALYERKSIVEVKGLVGRG